MMSGARTSAMTTVTGVNVAAPKMKELLTFQLQPTAAAVLSKISQEASPLDI